MKNRIVTAFLLSLLTLMLSFGASAQESNRAWSIGPEIGVNFSKLGRDGDEAGYNTGLIAGGFVTYSTGGMYAFTVKALLSEKVVSGELFYGIDTKFRLNYIEVPVLMRIFSNREGIVRPNIFLGPSFGYMTSANIKFEDGDFENFDYYEIIFKKFELGVTAGLGLSIKIAREMYFIVDARCTYGLTNILSGPRNANNEAISISAGFSFGIGK